MTSPGASRKTVRPAARSTQPTAIVLAAGEGRSLFPLTKERPKALLRVGGEPLLARLARQLHGLGVSRLAVVAGYRSEKVLSEIREIRRMTGMDIAIVQNERYSMTNTLYSLDLAGQRHDAGPVLIIDGDVICEDAVLRSVIEAPQPAVLAVDSCRVMGDEEVKVRYDRSKHVQGVGKDLKGGLAEFLGISKFSGPAAQTIFRACRRILTAGASEAEFYEAALHSILGRACQMTAVDMAGLKWVEVDFLTDYQEALRLFGTDRELKAFQDTRRTRRQYLFCPGPVLVSDQVKNALVTAEIGHREVEFSELLNRVRMKLARVYGVRNFHRYASVVLTGSGSAANEAVLGTACIGKKTLILANGEFGDRLIELANHLDLTYEVLQLRWGHTIPLGQAEEMIKRPDIDGIYMVHHETSTGMLNPLKEIAQLARCYRKELYVDAVSSIGAVPVDVEDHEITFCTASSNKAIACVPGLSFVCGKRAAFDALQTVRARSAYLDLHKHFIYNDRQYQTPNTPAVNLFFALEAALDAILGRGLTNTFERYRQLSHQLRSGLKDLGFRFLIPEELMAPVLTTVELPAGHGADQFHDRLKELGYITYPGKGILHDRVFQVANIGELNSKQVASFLRALAKVKQ